MLKKLLENNWIYSIGSIALAALGAMLLYFILFYGLRSIFRKLERDIALVTLNVSSYPILIIFVLTSLKLSFHHFVDLGVIQQLEKVLQAGLIVAVTYWLVQLFKQVILYYLEEYTKQTEAMWDDVLLPILEAVIPVIIFILGGALVLKNFGVDLTGIWVALGGATFVIGFALQDILANFFSGIVLLIDTPFRFGDVLSLEDGTIGMLRKIGVRVTELYIFNSNSDIYIPNSVLQGQKITNLSRPTPYYHCSTTLEIPLEYDLKEAKKIMQNIILAHPDTLGDIEQKLEFLPKYYIYDNEQNLQEQQEIGKQRLIKENAVNEKLEEIEQSLEALVVTLQFAEKGGLTPEEIENIQQEYQAVLELVGFTVNLDNQTANLEESQVEESLIELVREWYRSLIRDPNLIDEDSYLISEEWERKINLLHSRTQKLYQKIGNPQAEETRLDDYVLEIIKWLKEKFKQPRKKWQDPQIRTTEVRHEDSYFYVKFSLNFFVDDLKLEDGKRSQRVKSQIYQEITRYIKTLNPTADIKEIKGENYAVCGNFTTGKISFKGVVDSEDTDTYNEMAELLNKMVENLPPILTLDLKELSFINSLGINMLSQFILSLRHQKDTQLVVLGSHTMPWQEKSLKTLERLLPDLKLLVE